MAARQLTDNRTTLTEQETAELRDFSPVISIRVHQLGTNDYATWEISAASSLVVLTNTSTGAKCLIKPATHNMRFRLIPFASIKLQIRNNAGDVFMFCGKKHDLSELRDVVFGNARRRRTGTHLYI